MFTPAHDWKNWMGNLEARVGLYEPRNELELQRAVVHATASGKVRAVGGSNAWSQLVPPKHAHHGGSIISLQHFDNIRHIDAASTPPTMTVQAGWPIKRLVKVSEKHDLTLISPTIFEQIRLGGALAVGAHGTGLGWGTMADAVESMRVVTADGSIQQWTAADGDLFDAALVGLGCFGVVFEVKLRCEKAFHVHVEDRLIPREEVLSGIDDLLATYEFLELYWFPFNDTMWVKAISRTTQPLPKNPWKQDLHDAFNETLTILGAKVLPWMSTYAPGLTPAFMKMAPFFEMTEGTRIETSSDEFHYQRAYPRCWDMSWGVPLADAEQAWRDTIGLVEAFASRKQYPVNFCVHSRFVGKSRAWMAASYEGPICDIEVATGKGTPNTDPFFQAWTDQMLLNPHARPHWGKYILSPERLRARYARAGDFVALARSKDPAGVFTNEFLGRHIFQEIP